MSLFHSLPVLQLGQRPGPLLHPTPLSADAEVLGLNLTRGCVHRCVFCSARAVPNYQGDERIELDSGLIARLETELRQRRPRAVFLSPSSDPFPPLNEVQDLTGKVVETLARHNVSAWLMTRGLIRTPAMERLTAHREQVKVTVVLTTTDRSLQRRLEPLTASPRLRLRQIVRLREAGIPVQVSLDPLIPGVTDTTANLQPLLEALSAIGVRHVSAGYLFLREGIRENLAQGLKGTGLDEVVLEEFQTGPLLTAPGLSPALYLPRARRQRGYARLMSLAAAFGIRVSISAVSNPDFGSPARTTQPSAPRPSLRALFARQQERA